MSSGIVRSLALVVAGGHELAGVQRDGTDGNLSLVRGGARLGQGEHHGVVVTQGGWGVSGGDAPVCEVGSWERKSGVALSGPPHDGDERSSCSNVLRVVWSCVASVSNCTRYEPS